jgi:hypothetical protein
VMSAMHPEECDATEPRIRCCSQRPRRDVCSWKTKSLRGSGRVRSIRRSRYSTLHLPTKRLDTVGPTGPETWRSGRSPCATCRPQEGRHDDNQRGAAVLCAIVVCRSTRGGHRWATDDRALSGERAVASPRREAPVPAWAGVIAPELHGSHESSGAGTRRSLSARVNPGRRRLSRSSGALPFGLQAAGASWTPTLGVARRHADQVCVVDAPKSVSPKRSRKRDWHTGLVDARARPEGKTVTVTIVGGPTTRSYEQRPPGRPGCPNCREAIACRSRRLRKKPGESGSGRSLTALIRKRTRDDGRSGDRPLGRFGISRLLACPFRLGDARLTASGEPES